MRNQIYFLAMLATNLGFFLIHIIYTDATVRFTNINCTALDKEFLDFEYCYIKSYNRSYKYISIRVKLLKPIYNITGRFTLLKRANGYKPFLYNITADGCEFLHGKRMNPVVNYFSNLFLRYTNLNHSCPYNHDLILEKLDTSHLNNQMTNILPMPRGEYCISADWIISEIKRVNIRVFIELT